ncbi:hypothetical protein QTG54_014443 [Skeletonema marinoi]|uniref:Uncharacterized protein n=1 Tax=Skeletonema marinoi TaxID=267567 RepID=A0AAD9D6V9_9STRA|nr:hypothetical protein QTG54_014443 [Skeletonema marinoi]
MPSFNGRVIRSREVQRANAHASILSSLIPNFTSVRASQLSNAPPLTILADGRLMLLKDSQ